MDSINHSLTSSLICPAIRTKYLKNQYRRNIYGQDYFIVDTSYSFSNTKNEDFSFSHHLLPLIGCNNKETIPIIRISPIGIEERCGACMTNTIGTTYYFCNECDKWYHKECVESPPIFNCSYHPKHSLQLYIMDDSLSSSRLICRSCSSYYVGLIYHCSICNFDMDPVCATKPPMVNNRKRHEHTLYYFPRKSVLVCDVCALHDDKYSFIFVCLRCDFVVHKRCIYLPYVIKISRHRHRLSFVYSLSFLNWFCGVCRQKIDKNYGAYSCMEDDCIYVVHSNCATKDNIWDGKDLQGEPEEVNESIEPPFKEISDGVILHFSHPKHPMRLYEDVYIWYDEKKNCQACILPLYDGKAYTCMHMECDYVLHEECAYFPRVKQHDLHAHSLTLEPYGTQTIRRCKCCGIYSFGFKYVCHNTNCENFKLDVRCASISEPYKNHSHRHPLFLTDSKDRCSICHQFSGNLTCDECRFFLCFRCATLPYKVRYKNDEHLLTLLYEKDTKGDYWCDICEKEINPFTGVYRCNECEVTLDIKCLLGNDFYMSHGSRVTVIKEEFHVHNNLITQKQEEFNIVLNNALTRPICRKCKRRCKYKMLFEASSGDIYCSIEHIDRYRRIIEL